MLYLVLDLRSGLVVDTRQGPIGLRNCITHDMLVFNDLYGYKVTNKKQDTEPSSESRKM